MTNSNQPQQNAGTLTSALAEVRSAYRLTAAYQRRVYDIIDEFVAAFPDREHYWWQPIEYSKPGSANPFQRWAWNMLPMMRASFLFLPAGADPNAVSPDQWMLELVLDSDSGFEAPPQGEPDPRNFLEVERCATTLRAIAWRPTRKAKLNWLHGLWNQAFWPAHDGVKVETSTPPLSSVAQTFDLQSLNDRQAVRVAAGQFRFLAGSALDIVFQPVQPQTEGSGRLAGTTPFPSNI